MGEVYVVGLVEGDLVFPEADPLPWTIETASFATCRWCDSPLILKELESRPRWRHCESSQIACAKPVRSPLS